MNTTGSTLSPLSREEYIEQSHFFAVLAERIAEGDPAQEVLASIREQVLATTNLPLAIDFLLAELRHQGAFAGGMQKLSHYFTPFQCYVMSEAENDKRRFDLRIGLEILSREASYRASEHMTRAGLFVFQFESLCRNRLGYDQGLDAMSRDPTYDSVWSEWLLTVRRQIGMVELADLIYVRSEFYHHQQDRMAGRIAATAEPSQESPEKIPSGTVLFGLQEGRIAWANRRKEPLLLFSALHRHLDYPAVPRPAQRDPEERLLPVLARRIEQLEARLRLVEEEQRGGIDLTRFYGQDPDKSSPSQ